MDAVQQSAIEAWIDDVCSSQEDGLPDKGPDCVHRPDRLPTPPSTSPYKLIRKRKQTDSSMPHIDPKKRRRATDVESASVVSVPLRDNITLSPSSTRTSSIGSQSRQRSASPTRIKAELVAATPKIVYLHESTDPQDVAVEKLLTFLTNQDDDWEPDPTEVQKISESSCKFAVELRSEGSWIIDVARPLLQLAIGTLPLECWSVQTESVDPKYLPKYTARDAYSRKIDLVIGLPKEQWVAEYDRVGSHVPGRYQSHIAHPPTGKRLLGPALEIKAADGNLVEAQVQLGVWMAGFMAWAFEHRTGPAVPPPTIGCVVVGERWEFYIIYGIEGPSSELSEVRVYGPISDLDGRTGKAKGTSALAKTLRRVMEYTRTQYAVSLLDAIAAQDM